MKVDGTVDKYKARLVAKGYRHRENVDFFDTYSPVTRVTSIRVLMSLASVYNLVVHQMDFDMKDLGEANVILGIKITRTENGVSLDQFHYIEKILKKYGYFDCKPASTPYDPSVKLFKNTGNAVRGPNLGLHYERFPAVLEGYSDADWNTLSDDSKATRGYIFSIAGGVLSWKSKKQTILAQSTME
ncbi:uncharacterized protein LOC110682853 [Chenopodium quinoa]|uniref:uncharacterized protein LOC110682853 n=1 Tax=Chenopodium quinoa TaxID=63459 RepID=UPI000B77B72E|nr:uncharacterized protein LOC110682853 [Chenopodium quinoa]